MADHPGVIFHDSPTHGRVASLARGPDIAEVINVLDGLEARGEDRVAETAQWLGIHVQAVRAAVSYYAAFREEIDRQIEERHREADEHRRRYEAERALLG